MSDIHVLQSNSASNEWRIVMHIPIPDTSNAVGVNWRIALINSGIGGRTSLPDGNGNDGTISLAEKTQITNGEIFEHSQLYSLETGGTSLPELQATIRELFTQEKLAKLNILQGQLRYYGHTESES